ncbi:MAG: PAS domain-containing protein [Deltaproteobacteria bacterium]|jgi:PAS domain S-box-containing protein|nr:PAS domain-containing protein [Deltaproteobacteria bacterium]MBN2844585.1 PAS domain-containing protein [Deltaproteobacteria bacterium]
MIGTLSEKVLDAVLETIPVEFSVVDENDKVLAWNYHETRIFKRPKGALGRDVRDCHPKRSLEKVEIILKEMKEGKRETARFWVDLPIGPDKEKQKVLIEYYALRDSDGTYLGCLEASRNIQDLLSITGQRRLLD